MRDRVRIGILCTSFAVLAAYFAYSYRVSQPTLEPRLSAIEHRINQHYREYRPFQFRWPGVPYGPLRGHLGTVDQKKSQKQLGTLLYELDQAELGSSHSSRSLQLRARIELLNGDYDRAVQHYQQAILQTPSESGLQLELGIGFALRAGKDSALDYEHSLEAMLQAGRSGQTPEAVFDTALLFTKIPLPSKAIEGWQRTLSSEPASLWRHEAQEQLAKLQQDLDTRQQRIHDLTLSPESYLAHASESDSTLELVVDRAIEDWLPLAANSGSTREALNHLATALKTARQDQWLFDMIRAPASPGNSLALKLLGEARRAGAEGKLDVAQTRARDAEALFSSVRNPAGALRARLEGVHSIVRHWNPESCIRALSGIRSSASAKGYVWIEGQAWLEEITCKTQTRQADLVTEREKAYGWITKTGYEALSLRALSFLTEDYVSFDSRLTTWKRGCEGLQRFWNIPMQPVRGYTFYYTLGRSAQIAGDYRAAVALLEEGIHELEQSRNQQLFALEFANLGAWQWQAGLHEAANRSFDRMEFLFSRLDKNEVRETWTEAEIIRAEIELEDGKPDQAISRLDRLASGTEFPHLEFSAMHRRRLLPAYGNAYLNKSALDLASKYYEQIISESRRDLRLIASQAQRDNAQHEIETAWRGLTEVQLRRNQVKEAWATWEQFRSGRFQSSQPFPSTPPEGVSLLVYAFLPNGLSAWLVQDKGIERHWLDSEDAEKAGKQAERLALLVSDRQSPIEAVSASAQDLYSLLIQPFAARLPLTGTLVVDADGPLAGIPWSTLEDRQGRPLVERFAIAQAVGWAEVSTHLLEKPVDLSRPLIFGQPRLGPELTKEFPVLPEAQREAEYLKAKLANAVLLEEDKATLSALLDHLPEATFFYFAGHGLGHGGFGALLVAPEPGDKTEAAFVGADELAKLNLRQLKLAVLASCSSGVGEQSGLVNLDSLARGFLEAGTTRVVAARWNVNSSETASMMTEFYDRLRGQHPAEALRQAELRVRENAAHPYYWAGLQVFGAP